MSPTPELFVGRADELQTFQHTIQAMLAQAGQRNQAPYVALVHGEHGTGKSALLRQFARLASSGVKPERLFTIDLTSRSFESARDLAGTLADPLRPLLPNAFMLFDDLAVERSRLEQRYHELRTQWQRWQALQELGPQTIDDLLRHYGVGKQQALRHTLFGAGYAPSHAASQLERVIDDLSWLLQFRDVHNRSPTSFDELLDWALKHNAELFRNDERFGVMLAAAINQITADGPLMLLIDGYEAADRYDGWLRAVLAQLSGPLLLAIAGRRRLDGAYRQTFVGRLANRITFIDANQPLTDDNQRAYLVDRLGLVSTQPTPLLDEATTIAAGVPIALVAVGDQLTSGGTLAPYRDLPNSAPEAGSLQRALVAGFFSHILGSPNGGAGSFQTRLHDRQRLRVLALLRPDAELLAAGWGLATGVALALYQKLAAQYSFLFRGSPTFGIHPLARELASADARAARRRPTEWQPIAAGLDRALVLVDDRLQQLNATLGGLAAGYHDANWRQATLDQLRLLLLLGQHDRARDLLLNNWVEARYEFPPLADWLFEHAAGVAPRGAGWPQLLAALQTADYDLLAAQATSSAPQTKTILGYLRTRRLPLPIASANTAGALDRRIELLEQAHMLAPSWSPAKAAYAEALSARGHYKLYKLGTYEAALADFDVLLTIDPNYRAAYSRRGFAHQALGQYAAAIDDWNQALNAHPDSATARYGRAATLVQYYEQQRWLGDAQAGNLLDQALADLNKLLADFPNDHVALCYRGLAHYYKDALADAERDLQAACALEPTRAKSQSAYAMVLAAQARTQAALGPQALNTALQAYTLDPNDFDVVLNRGLIEFEFGQPADAASHFDQALALRPEHAPALFYRSRFHFQQRQLDAALDDVDRALVQAPNYPDVYLLRAEIQLRRADSASGKTRQRLLQQASADAEKALQLRQNDASAMVWRAHIAALRADLGPAQADITTAMAIQANGHSYAVRGYVRQQQANSANQAEQHDRYAEALNDLNAAVAQNDEWAETYARRGLVFHGLGQHDDAIDDFDHALTIRQNDPQILFWRAKAQAYDLGKLDQAEQNLDDSLKVQPGQPDVLYERGNLLLARGKYKAAIRDFAALLKIEPNNRNALAQLAKAKRLDGDMIGAVPHYWAQVGNWTRGLLNRP